MQTDIVPDGDDTSTFDSTSVQSLEILGKTKEKIEDVLGSLDYINSVLKNSFGVAIGASINSGVDEIKSAVEGLENFFQFMQVC